MASQSRLSPTPALPPLKRAFTSALGIFTASQLATCPVFPTLSQRIFLNGTWDKPLGNPSPSPKYWRRGRVT